ncbi:MAG: ROK family protein [Verrucomicrobia bacterium]|nr:ROK family protein [Verrucomicrobiota bacterium]
MSEQRRLSAGIDIGGTKIAVGLVDRSGQIVCRQSFATPKEFQSAVSSITLTLGELLRAQALEFSALAGLGIGCAGPVNPRTGLVNNPYTLPGWEGGNLITSLQSRVGLPVYLENDADAALLGESLAGAARGFDPVVMLTFGTGIGGAALSGNAVFRGAAGEHPEIGHVPVMRGGAVCYCGRSGCLESIASGAAIEKAGQEHGFHTARDVFVAASVNNSRAKAIIDQALDATACAAWALLHTFLPQRFVLGGGIIDDHFRLFASAIQQSIDAAAMIPRHEIAVVKAALGNDAGLVGAAALAFRGTG